MFCSKEVNLDVLLEKEILYPDLVSGYKEVKNVN